MGLLKTGIKGVAWTTVSVVTRSIVSMLQITILTKLLVKSDFGIVAIASLFIGFTQIFLDLGISTGIMHKQDTTAEQYSSLFWLNIMTGGILTTILCTFVAPVAARMYNEPILVKILSLLSLTVFFSSLGAQHRTMQQKEMRFHYISMVEISSSILTFLVAVLLAKSGFRVFSLVYSTLFNAVYSNMVFLIIGLSKDRNLSFHFNFIETIPFLKIGLYSVGAHILDYFSREIDTIIISAAFGKETLGLYSLCKKIVQMLYGITNQILVKVITPIFAKIQNDIDVITNTYYDIIESISLANFPIYFLIAIFAKGTLNFLYGSQYQDGALLLSLLAIHLGSLSSASPTGCLQISLGRTDVGFYWTIIRIFLNSLATYIGSRFSIEGIVLSLFIIVKIITPISWWITVRPLIGGKFFEYFMKSFKPLCFAALLSLPYYYLFNSEINIVKMVLISCVYMTMYIVLIFVLFRQASIVKMLKYQIFSHIFKNKENM